MWAERFIRFHGLRHPATMGAPEIERFLTDLAANGHVAASTQNQAFHALLFLYQQVLGIELPRLSALRARWPRRLEANGGPARFAADWAADGPLSAPSPDGANGATDHGAV